MDPIVIHGHPGSTNTRTVRLLIAEKGGRHALRMPPFGTDAHADLHPFRKMPALTCGDLRLFESLAISSWLDETLPGPRFIPVPAAARAQALSWCSAAIDYLYHDVVKGFAFAAMTPADERDAAAFSAATERAGAVLAPFDAALAEGPWLLGEALTLPDLYLAPILAFVASLPEGRDLVGQHPALRSHLERVRARPSWAATEPADG